MMIWKPLIFEFINNDSRDKQNKLHLCRKNKASWVNHSGTERESKQTAKRLAVHTDKKRAVNKTMVIIEVYKYWRPTRPCIILYMLFFLDPNLIFLMISC